MTHFDTTKGKILAEPATAPHEDLLMWEMVNAMEIDLASAIQRDELPLETLGAMMRNCHNCPAPRMCAVFLDSRTGQTPQAPSYCPNRDTLAELRHNKRFAEATAAQTAALSQSPASSPIRGPMSPPRDA